MRESRLYGSVRGARGNSRPYRETNPVCSVHVLPHGTKLPKPTPRLCPQPAEAENPRRGSVSMRPLLRTLTGERELQQRSLQVSTPHRGLRCDKRDKNVEGMVNRMIRLCCGLVFLTLGLGVGPAAAQSPPTLKIGLGLALSGGLAAGGKQALLAYELWAEGVNARGGLLGRKVELVRYDDQSNPATVPGIYSKLLDVDKVDIVLSGYGTVPTAAALPIITQRKKLFLSLFALAANDAFKYDRYFQLQPNGPDAKVEFSRGYFELAAALNPKPQTVAIAGADAEFSVLAMEGARENAKKHGIRVVYDRTYPPSSVEFGTVVRAIKAANPDLVYIASYPPDSAGMIRSIHEVGLGGKMVGGGMIGLQFAALKTQLGPLLNDIVCYELYAPEPSMKFPGIERVPGAVSRACGRRRG